MIQKDQPSNLHAALSVYISSRSDGTMLDRTLGTHAEPVLANRYAYCQAAGISYDEVVYQKISYSPELTYDSIAEVGSESVTSRVPDVTADGLLTREAGVGLFLPVADCVATVVFDPVARQLALLHLGRHSTLTDLIPNMIQRFSLGGSDPKNLIVWMSPSAQKQSYKLERFAFTEDPRWAPFCRQQDDGIYLDMQGYNRQRLIDEGLLSANISVSPIDTMSDPNYFSHALGDTYGRMAVLTMMR